MLQVRRAAAQHLAKFAAVVEPEFVGREFVSHFHQLTQDGALAEKPSRTVTSVRVLRDKSAAGRSKHCGNSAANPSALTCKRILSGRLAGRRLPVEEL